MNKVLMILLAIIALAAAVFGIVMTVMAVRFMEWGRVLFYGMIAMVSLEVFVLTILNLKKKS